MERDGAGRWRWGVDDEVHGALVDNDEGGIEPEAGGPELQPMWETTALLLARQAGGRLNVDHQPPTRLYPDRAPTLAAPPREPATLAERAASGRQGSL